MHPILFHTDLHNHDYTFHYCLKSRPGQSLIKWLARFLLALSVALVTLYFFSIHPPAFLLWCSMPPAVAAFVVRPSPTLRTVALINLAFALLLGAHSHARAAKLQRFIAAMRPFEMHLNLIRRRIAVYHRTNPEVIITNLGQLVSQGVLSPADTNMLANASVIVYPYNPYGKEADILLDIRHGPYRTLVSQVGGVFTYTPRTIKYLGTSEKPSDAFLGAVQDYRSQTP